MVSLNTYFWLTQKFFLKAASAVRGVFLSLTCATTPSYASFTSGQEFMNRFHFWHSADRESDIWKMGSSKWSWICPARLSLNPTFAEPSVARCREVVTCSLCSACCGHAVHYQLDTTPGGVLKSQSLEMTKCATSAGADAAQRQPRGANRSGSRAAQAAAAAAQCSARASAVAGGRLNTATVRWCEGCTKQHPSQILDPCLPSQVYNAQR